MNGEVDNVAEDIPPKTLHHIRTLEKNLEVCDDVLCCKYSRNGN